MFRAIIGFSALILLSGCASKKEQALMQSYVKNISYHKHLQQTEKAEIRDENGSSAILTATHLYQNNFEKNDTRPERFIVGIQFENPEGDRLYFDQNMTENNSIDNNISAYTLTLGKKKALSVVALEENDERLKNISFVTDWGSYYEVMYPHAGSRFSLLFSHPLYGKKKLHFTKVAKFVYSKKGF
jgi:hypothetical protein